MQGDAFQQNHSPHLQSKMNYGNTTIWMRVLEARNLYTGFQGTHTHINVRLKGHSHILYETKPWTSASMGLPFWNEEFNFVSARPEKDIIVIHAYDTDIHGHRHLIGKTRIPVWEFMGKGLVDQWFVLAPARRHAARGALGDIHVQFMCGGLPQSYGFLADPKTLPTLQTTTLWVPAAVPYVPLTTSTIPTGSTVPAPPVLPQMPTSGHTALPPKPLSAPIPPATGLTTTTYYTPATQIPPGTYMPYSH